MKTEWKSYFKSIFIMGSATLLGGFYDNCRVNSSRKFDMATVRTPASTQWGGSGILVHQNPKAGTFSWASAAKVILVPNVTVIQHSHLWFGTTHRGRV